MDRDRKPGSGNTDSGSSKVGNDGRAHTGPPGPGPCLTQRRGTPSGVRASPSPAGTADVSPGSPPKTAINEGSGRRGGIAPGAGVGNDRAELSRHTLGIPVVSMGIPTVVDCRTLLHDLGLPAPAGVPQSMVVTPRDVDLLIDRGAHLIGMAVNHAAQPELTPEEIACLIA